MKQIFDFTVSLLVLTVLSPLMLVLCLLVYLKLGSPVFFYQLRPGKGGRIFRLYKFRSMTNDRDSEGRLLPNEKRITPFGRFLRSASLDELPALYNVLKGDMSLVGPRPLLVDYLPFYTALQQRRHEVLPGITGWAQVNGRNAIGWDEKMELDIWYVENRSFLLDLRILLLTIRKVILREGIEHGDGQFMPRFDEYMQSKNKINS